MRPAFGRTILAILLIAAVSACTGKSSNDPLPAAPTPTRASITITSVDVSSTLSNAAFVYRVVVHLRESAGTAGRIDQVDLRFARDGNTLVSSRHDQVLAGSGSTVAANGTGNTRELVTTDPDLAHGQAATVTAFVTYNDSIGQAAVSASSNIPPLGDPPAPTHSLSGTIRDQVTGAAIAGARVEALNGVNRGAATTTDDAGNYTLDRLTRDTFRMRASADGYDPGEQNVTVPETSRADMLLRRPGGGSGPCSYSVSPASILGFPWQGGQGTLTIARTAGSCAWQATSNASWLQVVNPNGNGDATLTLVAGGNSFNARTGVITISWTGGQSQVSVTQGTPPDTCMLTLTVGGQSTINVPAAGGSYTASLQAASGVAPGACGAWTVSSSSPRISFTSATSGPAPGATLSFNVASNVGNPARELKIIVSGSAGAGATLTMNQQ